MAYIGFQTTVNQVQGVGVAGEIATVNPISTYPTPTADVGYVAGDDGVTVARFLWRDPADTTGRKLNNSSATSIKPIGFLAREQQAIITDITAIAGNFVPEGYPVTAFVKGDYFVTSIGAAAAGQKIFASLTTGQATAADAGTSVAGYIETDYTVTQGCLAGELAIMSL